MKFADFHRATAHMSGPERLAAFYALPAEQQADVWSELEARMAHETDHLRRGRVPPPTPIRAARRAPAGGQGLGHGRDVVATLRAIEPRAYVEQLVGVEVPHSGFICCPLAGHEDRSPSFKVYADPERGFFCFGCARGGDIFSLAGHLWGIDPRGAGFSHLRQRLADELGVSA